MAWVSRPIVPMTELQRGVASENVALAYSYAGRRGKTIKCLNADDLLELAWFGLCRAAQVHDPLLGKFSTIATWCMRSEINDAITGFRRQKRCPTGKLLSLADSPNRGKIDPAFNDVDIADWLECFQG